VARWEAQQALGVAGRGVPPVAAPATVVRPVEVLLEVAPVVEPEPERALEVVPPRAAAGLAAAGLAAAGLAAAGLAAAALAAGSHCHLQRVGPMARTPVTRRAQSDL